MFGNNLMLPSLSLVVFEPNSALSHLVDEQLLVLLLIFGNHRVLLRDPLMSSVLDSLWPD